MIESFEIGKLLRASTSGFIVGCRLSNEKTPKLGALVEVFLEKNYRVFGLITDIHIDDDGLVRQLATNEYVAPEIIADNRINRNIPLEINVLVVGYGIGEKIFHLLPPRPPLSLDTIYNCSPEDIYNFTQSGHFGYFRHIIQSQDLNLPEILAAHLQQANEAHVSHNDPDWLERATNAVVTLLRDDYQSLMNVLGALSDMQITRGNKYE
jgi:hypothetical protein